MKKSDFLHADTDLRKLKVVWKILGWAWSKMGKATLKSYSNNFWVMVVKIWTWPFWSWDSKSCYITRMNWWSELIFCMVTQIQGKSYFDNYLVGGVKNGWCLIDHGTLKSVGSHRWFDELSRLTERFLHVVNDTIIFGLTTGVLCVMCT